MIRSKMTILMTAAILGLALAPGAQAQLVQPPVAQSAESYSDVQLKSFATALLHVSRLHEVFLPQLELARTPQEQQMVVLVATEAMAEVVQRNGMTVEQYDSLLAQAQADPALADRIKGYILNVE